MAPASQPAQIPVQASQTLTLMLPSRCKHTFPLAWQPIGACVIGKKQRLCQGVSYIGFMLQPLQLHARALQPHMPYNITG